MDRLKSFWQAQAAAEYNSALVAMEFAKCLGTLGAPPELIRDCLQIATDEIDHASICRDVYVSLGGAAQITPPQGYILMQAQYQDARMNAMFNVILTFCLGESVAVPLFSMMKKSANHHLVLSVYERIIRDEPRHAEFGWITLAWMYRDWAEARGWVQGMFADALSRMAQQYYFIGDYLPALSNTELAWGMIPVSYYRSCFEAAVSGVYARRMRHYGVDAEATWCELQALRIKACEATSSHSSW